MPDGAADALGTIRLTPSSSATDLIGALGVHARVIEQIDKDIAAGNKTTHDRFVAIERMLEEQRGRLTGWQAEARAEWVPEGTERDAERRYVQGDIVLIGRVTTARTYPDGSPYEEVQEGYLTDPYPVTEEQQRAQNAYRGFALAYARGKRTSGNPWADPLCRLAWQNFAKQIRAIPGKIGAFMRGFIAQATTEKRVINNTSGTGAELIMTPQVGDLLRRPYDLTRRVAGLIRSQAAPAPSFKPPIVTGRALARKRGKTTDDPARYQTSTFTTSDTTITVVDRQVTALLDPLWVTDAATMISDPMGLVLDWLEQGDADTVEMMLLHGDTAGTHQDTLSTWTMGGMYTAGDLDGSSSMLKQTLGFRAISVDDSTTASAGGTFDIADHLGRINALGVHAGSMGVVAITGLDCLYTQLLPYTNFLTVDKFGPQATIITGQIGNISGTPIIISQMMPKQFDTSNGLYTGSNSGNAIVYVDTEAFTLYEYAAGESSFDQLYAEKGAQYVGFVRRAQLAKNVVSGELACSYLYNL